MTAQAFVKALTSLTALHSLMVEHLNTLSPKMTPAERKATAAKMKATDKALQSQSKVTQRILAKGKTAMTHFRRVEMPKVRRIQEKHEHAAEIAEAEKKFS